MSGHSLLGSRLSPLDSWQINTNYKIARRKREPKAESREPHESLLRKELQLGGLRTLLVETAGGHTGGVARWNRDI